MNIFPSRSTLRCMTNNDHFAASFLLLVLGNNLSLAHSRAIVRPSIDDHTIGAFCTKEPVAAISFSNNSTDSIHSTTFSTNEPVNTTFTSFSSVEIFSEPSASESSNWYPDWGNSESCLHDDKEPAYMSNNPTYISSSKEECCNKFYFWKTSECMREGTASGLLTSTTILPSASAYGRGFYPDWSGTRNTCINDGNEPEYMQEWPEAWISNSVEECCNLHFPWAPEACLASAISSSVPQMASF